MKFIILWFVIILAIYSAAAAAVVAGEVQWGVVYEKQPSRPIAAKEWNRPTKLWLGRSCVGEAGFDSDLECIGIAWVYATLF